MPEHAVTILMLKKMNWRMMRRNGITYHLFVFLIIELLFVFHLRIVMDTAESLCGGSAFCWRWAQLPKADSTTWCTQTFFNRQWMNMEKHLSIILFEGMYTCYIVVHHGRVLNFHLLNMWWSYLTSPGAFSSVPVKTAGPSVYCPLQNICVEQVSQEKMSVFDEKA